MFHKIHKRAPVLESHFERKVPCRLINKQDTPTLFFCEFCKIFKNFCEWLLTNLFFENNPLAPKR